MEKLKVAKAIMNKSDNIKRGVSPQMEYSDDDTQPDGSYNTNVKYNIPNEFLEENKAVAKPIGNPTNDAILKSKLPDEIKKLMLEHPIQSQTVETSPISNELVQRAARLMNSSGPKSEKISSVSNSIDYDLIKQMIDESINSALKNNGLLFENAEKTNEIVMIKIGSHIFEGKISKIKKTKQL